MPFHRSVSVRSYPLGVQTLEGRIVPAGTILATLSPSGALSILGDDDFNVVTLLVTGNDVTLTPNGDTTINAAATGAPVTLVGVVKSIKADLKGGGDDVSINNAAAFNLSGAVAIALGDGNNTLTMNTTGIVSMASLTVTGGDGRDDVIVQGAVNSAVTKAGKFSYLNGGSTTTLDGVNFGSLAVTAGNGVANPNEVSLNNLTVTKAVSTALANSNPALVTITNSSIGGLKETGYILGTTILSSTVNGAISIKGTFQADLQLDGTTITKNVAITAPNASMTASGIGSTINGNLAITGTAYTQTSFQSTSLTEVKGNLSVKGAWFTDVFDANSFFRASKNVSLKLGDGDNEVTIGDGGPAVVSILGNLSIQTGAGNDLINLDRLALSGFANLKLSGGADELSIENNSTFSGAFTADMGVGDDFISIAQNTMTSGAITFTGLVKILAGVGNDTLLLGLDPIGSGGDATSNAIFSNLFSIIDGGIGLNDFDLGASQFSGADTPNW